ncbi:hypothetical protein OAG24_00435 [bacterium]|nr:hypothetical protein [bacterium]
MKITPEIDVSDHTYYTIRIAGEGVFFTSAEEDALKSIKSLALAEMKRLKKENPASIYFTESANPKKQSLMVHHPGYFYNQSEELMVFDYEPVGRIISVSDTTEPEKEDTKDLSFDLKKKEEIAPQFA